MVAGRIARACGFDRSATAARCSVAGRRPRAAAARRDDATVARRSHGERRFRPGRRARPLCARRAALWIAAEAEPVRHGCRRAGAGDHRQPPRPGPALAAHARAQPRRMAAQRLGDVRRPRSAGRHACAGGPRPFALPAGRAGLGLGIAAGAARAQLLHARPRDHARGQRLRRAGDAGIGGRAGDRADHRRHGAVRPLGAAPPARWWPHPARGPAARAGVRRRADPGLGWRAPWAIWGSTPDIDGGAWPASTSACKWLRSVWRWRSPSSSSACAGFAARPPLFGCSGWPRSSRWPWARCGSCSG